MHQHDHSIIEKSNVQTDVVVVNQCDLDSISEFDFTNKYGNKCHAKFINTTERGLSRSRNLAIQNAWGDICLICDDDELLDDDYSKKILSSYDSHPDKHVIIFQIERKDKQTPKKYPQNEGAVGLKQILQTSSVQITFRRNKILENHISFDVKLGSGTGNGAGEENKFLIDSKKAKLFIYYVPINIGTVLMGNSSWFKGYDAEYMRNRGWVSRRILGSCVGFAYIIFFVIRHRNLYSNNLSIASAFKNMFVGYLEKR